MLDTPRHTSANCFYEQLFPSFPPGCMPNHVWIYLIMPQETASFCKYLTHCMILYALVMSHPYHILSIQTPNASSRTKSHSESFTTILFIFNLAISQWFFKNIDSFFYFDFVDVWILLHFLKHPQIVLVVHGWQSGVHKSARPEGARAKSLSWISSVTSKDHCFSCVFFPQNPNFFNYNFKQKKHIFLGKIASTSAQHGQNLGHLSPT